MCGNKNICFRIKKGFKILKKVLTYLIYISKIKYNIDLLGETMKYEDKITTIKVILNEIHFDFIDFIWNINTSNITTSLSLLADLPLFLGGKNERR